jgi:hypothetical protein
MCVNPNTKGTTMPFALYWLIGSCLVLNAVSSLPIDDDAVSFSLSAFFNDSR